MSEATNPISSVRTNAGWQDITLSVDKAALRYAEESLAAIPDGIERAATRAINKVARKVHTQVVRAVAQRITVSQAELRRRNVFLRQANFQELQARVMVRGYPIPLKYFGARQTRTGVRYAVYRGQREELPHAFFATMPTGHRGVFLRREGVRQVGTRATTRRAKYPGSLPIDKQFGPPVPQVVEQAAELTQAELEQTAGAELETEIVRQADLLPRTT